MGQNNYLTKKIKTYGKYRVQVHPLQILLRFVFSTIFFQQNTQDIQYLYQSSQCTIIPFLLEVKDGTPFRRYHFKH